MENYNIWAEIRSVFGDLLDRLLAGTQTFVNEFLPALIIAVLTLVIGWILAGFFRKLTAKGLKAAGFDLILQRSGVQGFLDKHEVKTPPSQILGWAVYVVILYSALVLAFQRLDFETGAGFLISVAEWVPKWIVVLILLSLGNLLGRWLGGMLQQSARVAGVPWHQLIGALVRLSIVVFALLLSVRHLELVSDQVLLGILAIAGVAILLGGFLLAICARELVLSMITAKLHQKTYGVGDWIKVGDAEGTVEKFGSSSIRLKTPGGSIEIPAARIARETVEHRPKDS